MGNKSTVRAKQRGRPRQTPAWAGLARFVDDSGMSREDFAAKAGVAIGTLRCWINGWWQPGNERLRAVAAVRHPDASTGELQRIVAALMADAPASRRPSRGNRSPVM